MKDYIYIHSTKTIMVTAGLQYEDYTKKNSDVPNRMKVSPIWPKLKVLIKKGKFIYPSLITEWNTVKSLESAGILTIGEEVDDPNDSLIVEKNTDLKRSLDHFVKRNKQNKDINLNEVAK